MQNDTILALATPSGVGAIAVIRLSGPKALSITDQIIPNRKIESVDGNTVVFGTIRERDEIIDEVLITVFRAPKSYTKEDVIEISCHASPYIIQTIMRLCIERGAVPAKPGEFTQRAFLNGQMDLAQAEAVADVIAAENKAAHQTAMHQLRGGFSNEIKVLRQKLVDFASLIELELDFSEEDVEFADRQNLKNLVTEILELISHLIESFKTGNAIKKGVPVVIVGKPNAGKSTLLNKLLNEEKAIVSDIPGTTRDVIEDVMVIEGIQFRFIDTAGLRKTSDTIEAIGVERTIAKMEQAQIILYLLDATVENKETISEQLDQLKANDRAVLLPILNKVDEIENLPTYTEAFGLYTLSAKKGEGLDPLKATILKEAGLEAFTTGTVVTNARHHASLLETRNRLEEVLVGLKTGITGDFIAMDIRQALYHLGSITGEVTVDELLGNIFGKFCIGK